MACGRARMRDGHSSGTPVTRRLQQPTRTAGSRQTPKYPALSRKNLRAVPIRSCSRWGLPCRRRCRRRGALLPHLFTLTAPSTPSSQARTRRSVLCGTFPGLAPAGRYPAPFVHGARTFLPGHLSVSPERPSGRLTKRGMVTLAAAVKGRGRQRCVQRLARAPPCSAVGCGARAIRQRRQRRTSVTPSTRCGRKWR